MRSSRLAIVWPEFRQSCPWECSVSRPKWYKAHVAVTEKFTITNILNVVTQLQLEFCKSIQHLFKYPTNKNHHNFLHNHTKSISTWSLSNHESSKTFLNVRSDVVTTRGRGQVGLLVIPESTAGLYAPHQNSFEKCESRAIWNKQKLVWINKQALKNWIKTNAKSTSCF